jgi:hypothetical protein
MREAVRINDRIFVLDGVREIRFQTEPPIVEIIYDHARPESNVLVQGEEGQRLRKRIGTVKHYGSG